MNRTSVALLSAALCAGLGYGGGIPLAPMFDPPPRGTKRGRGGGRGPWTDITKDGKKYVWIGRTRWKREKAIKYGLIQE